MDLRFATFESELDMPFYSAFFSSKLDHDKLDDSARPLLGVYEARPQAASDASTRMQILGNALTSNQWVHSQVSLHPAGGWADGSLRVSACLLARPAPTV
jgi:ubiquitin-like modifier-activating enzyme ATG7